MRKTFVVVMVLGMLFFGVGVRGVMAVMPGDASGNNDVGLEDLAIWREEYGKTGLRSDFDGSGAVGFEDLRIWKMAYIEKLNSVDCDRCSVFYDNQRTRWRASDCNKSPASWVVVERIYDSTCRAPASTKKMNTCQRCSTVNQGQYVWWEIVEGESCSRDPGTGTSVYRAEGVTMCQISGPSTIDCDRCSLLYDNQRTSWRATNCDVSPGDGVVVERTYDTTCVAPASTRKANTCQRCSKAGNGQYTWWEPVSGVGCEVDPTGEVMKTTVGSVTMCNINTSETCPGSCKSQTPQKPDCGSYGMDNGVGSCSDPMSRCCVNKCTRCSLLYDNQMTSWVADNCDLSPASGVAVERTYDTTCVAPASTRKANTCQRCSKAGNGQYTWWEPVSGVGCEVDPTGEVMKTTVGSIAMCTETGRCERCSTVYPNQKVAYLGDCSKPPMPGIEVERIYDIVNCGLGKFTPTPGVTVCQRCSETVSGQYVWWKKEDGKTCNDDPGAGVEIQRTDPRKNRLENCHG